MISDDKYAWYANLGKDTAEEAYKVVRDEIVKVATLAKAGNYEAIDALDRLGHSYKWKIAFLYSDEKLIPVYNRGMLISFASHLGMQKVNKSKTVEIQRFLMEKKGSQDVYSFYDQHSEFCKPENKAVSFDAVKAALIEKLEDDDRFVVKKSGKTFLWLGTKDELIGHSACHYEINSDNDIKAGHKRDYVYVEMHHEGKGTAPFKELQNIEGVKTFKWLVLGERLNDEGWNYKDVNLDKLTDKLLQGLYDLDNVIGARAREIAQIEKIRDRDTVTYWLYAPGEQASFWDEYYQEGIMGLGWNKIGDLKEYNKQEDLIVPLKTNYGDESSQVQNANMLYSFANDMKPGDVIFAKKGRSLIVGRGVVTSDYYYDDSRENHPHLRKVNWQVKGDNFYSFATKYCSHHQPENFAIYDSYVEKVLEELNVRDHFGNFRKGGLRNYYTYMNAIYSFQKEYGFADYTIKQLDQYLWQLGKWYFNQYGLSFKYYNREEQNPYAENDIRNRFWHGEMMFVTSHISVGEWKAQGKLFLKEANEKIQAFAATLTPEQFGVVTYISTLFGKWMPYDGQTWIIEY